MFLVYVTSLIDIVDGDCNTQESFWFIGLHLLQFCFHQHHLPKSYVQSVHLQSMYMNCTFSAPHAVGAHMMHLEGLLLNSACTLCVKMKKDSILNGFWSSCKLCASCLPLLHVVYTLLTCVESIREETCCVRLQNRNPLIWCLWILFCPLASNALTCFSCACCGILNKGCVPVQAVIVCVCFAVFHVCTVCYYSAATSPLSFCTDTRHHISPPVPVSVWIYSSSFLLPLSSDSSASFYLSGPPPLPHHSTLIWPPTVVCLRVPSRSVSFPSVSHYFPVGAFDTLSAVVHSVLSTCPRSRTSPARALQVWMSCGWAEDITRSGAGHVLGTRVVHWLPGGSSLRRVSLNTLSGEEAPDLSDVSHRSSTVFIVFLCFVPSTLSLTKLTLFTLMKVVCRTNSFLYV